MTVIDEIKAEMDRQVELWGEQNHPDFLHVEPYQRAKYYSIPTENQARDTCEFRFNQSAQGTWGDILLEELCEAYGTGDDAKLREELIQVAAVAGQWVNAIDRRTS